MSKFFQPQNCISDECKDNIEMLYVVALIMLCCCVIQCKDITHRHGFRTGEESETARQSACKTECDWELVVSNRTRRGFYNPC